MKSSIRFRPRPPAHRTGDQLPASPRDIVVAECIVNGDYDVAQDFLE
jgi:hypothetical protein